MAFRTLEIAHPAELHIRSGQLCIEQESGTAVVPLEDIATIVCLGSGIRISTMAMSMLCENEITMLMLDTKYMPSGVLHAYDANARQSLVMRNQISLPELRANEAWRQLIHTKIMNQSRALSILGLDGVEEVAGYAARLTGETPVTCEMIEAAEAAAARVYFQYFYPGLNRRTDDPMNSHLNYGYAVLRSALIRALAAAGFLQALGLHHSSQLNSFNLADDVIEPWRPMVDLIAHGNVDANVMLSRKQRKELAHVLHNACMIEGKKMTILSAIDIMIETLRNFVLDEGWQKLTLPVILPVESAELVNE